MTGSVMFLALDAVGTRLLIATVRYPEGGMRRDELQLHELTADGKLVHRLTRDIADSASVALAPDGSQLAVGCGADVCIHEWGSTAIHKQLAGPGKRMEIGALALRPDVGLVVAAQRQRMEILTWELGDGSHRGWVAAGAGERMRETVTPRFHGRPSWTRRWVGVSRDGQRVASIRDDGTVALWHRDGRPIKALSLPF